MPSEDDARPAIVCCVGENRPGDHQQLGRRCRHMDSDSLTEHSILSHLHVPVVRLCESLKPLEQEIIAMQESVEGCMHTHGIADPSAASPDDVLQLSLGGTERRFVRKHLTEGEGVEGTLLGALFSGRWDGLFIEDDSQRMFLDVDADAFRIIHKAILEGRAVQQATRDGGRDGFWISHLLTEAEKRQHKGLHDFWIKKLLSSINLSQTPAGKGEQLPAVRQPPSVPAEGIPSTASGLVTALNDVLKAYHDKKSKLEGELGAEKIRYEQLMTEAEAVTPFLRPVSGDEVIRSVEMCGETIATTQSTVDEMSDKLRNRIDMWSRPVEDVPPDHMSRLVDHYRRKRLGASPDEAGVPLTMTDTVAAQRAFSINADMYGVKTDGRPTALLVETNAAFIRFPSGTRHQVVARGSGEPPSREQTVRYDIVGWADGFDGEDKICEGLGQEGRVGDMGDMNEWRREAILSMCVGEVRRLLVPGKVYSAGEDRFIELRLLAIICGCWLSSE
ncbi:unnamed protein product [Vitrella brassicaformis CCMP3155]|uniref:Potassium channel tetramerisation-type BTB domain-containing protein n=1 Tax=Vitrella brassicaformis (strain CCMP3155) TaxID=1169540 RepID=A0A0G4F4H4_VITBC|nr:unnamed protein product [Vitrella brassicaformis CCMP3155]|eukprot:CEM06946.1 unnamed protein product [Vitrella brassicaformis CCMP3155]